MYHYAHLWGWVWPSGAICINVDYHYLDQEVRNNQKRLNDFLDSFLKTDMVLMRIF